ncbi:MAG: hypothetical protein CYPHOPRED_002402 [Cyphobasidiales sp. Tagirdzhanova-0007]|nr:MAG: hypothetical protein CYPHOPRED_002402 [Cyphobasidiales sp. Tagirdzhanova-0007]
MENLPGTTIDEAGKTALGTTFNVTAPSEISHDEIEPNWTPAEENKARRRTDLFLLSFIVLMFIFLQFDRTNLGSALTGDFGKAIKVDQTQINLGQTLFTLGIVLFELPSQMVSKKIGPQIWVPCIMLGWGAITFCQMFIKNRSSFYATRFLLASFEAGFIPGMTFYLTRFYRNGELALRFAIFWSANSIAGIVSGIVALGLLSLNGHGGLASWQWLFLIEGVLTSAIAIAAVFYLPYGPSEVRKGSIFGRGIFSQRDVEIIRGRVLLDDPAKAFVRGTPISFVDIRDTFLDWHIYGHCAAAILSSVMITPMNTYGPSLVKDLGFAGYSANGLQAPGSALALIISVSLAWNSDRTRERGFHIAAVMLMSGVGALWLALPPSSAGKAVLYAGYVFTQGNMACGQGINAAWLASRVDERKRPVALAAYVASIQIAGFAGANVFQPKDAPRYRHGLIINACCAIAGAVVVLAWKYLYAYVEANKVVPRDEPDTRANTSFGEKDLDD